MARHTAAGRHRLVSSGNTQGRNQHSLRRPGRAVCQCGAHSEILPSHYDRACWHREHLAAVAAGRTRLPGIPT